MASSTPKAARTRLTSRVASSECPPSSKKLSSTPTRASASTSAKMSQSDLLLGRPRAHGSSRPAGRGAGRAWRSSLPLGVSGSASSTTKAEGTMYSGSRSAEVATQGRRRRAEPRAAGTR